MASCTQNTEWNPWFVWMASAENAMVGMGSEVWNMTKERVNTTWQGVYASVQRRTSATYQDIQVKMTSTYEDLYQFTRITYDQLQSRAVVKFQYLVNDLRLTAIQVTLKNLSPGLPSTYEEQNPPSLPPLADEAPPRPPDRPPKKPNLRSLFHGPNLNKKSFGNNSTAVELSSPESAEIRRIEESANELRNLSPAKPYFYRKPPAPDPPPTPPDEVTALPINSPNKNEPATEPSSADTSKVSHVQPMSRSSTPEPPPPPLVVEEEVLQSDEPLPPPPSEIPPEVQLQEALLGVSCQEEDNANPERAYHKDSYMAHRKDWKTGFEGRYRRTHSPSAPPQRTPLQPQNKPRDHVTNMNMKNAQQCLKDAKQTPAVTQNNNDAPGHLRSSLSTTKLSQSNKMPLDNDVIINNNNNLCPNIDTNGVNHNDWSAHNHHTSTTVTFSTEELRAFKARRAAVKRPQDRTAPPPPLRDVGGSVQSLASSSGSSNASTPSEVSSVGRYSAPWRTSLDSLHKPQPDISSGIHPPLRPISRAISVGEPLHRLEPCPDTPPEILSRSISDVDPLCLSSSTQKCENSAEVIYCIKDSHSSPVSVQRLSTSQESPILHDGPVTAHPATVTEESSSSSSPVSMRETPEMSSTPRVSPVIFLKSSPPTITLPITSLSEHFSTNVSPPISGPVSFSSPVRSTSLTSSPLQSPSTSFAPPIFTSSPISHHPFMESTTTLVSSSVDNLTSICTTTGSSTCLATLTKPSYLRTLSLTGTSCTMTSANIPPNEQIDRSNIVTLGFGRRRCQEELQCDKIAVQFICMLGSEQKLQNILVPGTEYRTIGNYMQGVFALELRQDLLCSGHSRHPDLKTISHDADVTFNHAVLPDRLECEESSRNGDRAPLPADSAYFTTSESKAKLLSKIRNSSFTEISTEPQNLGKKKEELLLSISRKLKMLEDEQAAIKSEMQSNAELGIEVTKKIEAVAKISEVNRYKLHAEEIDKITSLLLGLSGRLARAENALLSVRSDTSEDEKKIMEGKRNKLSEQLEEAKKLKESIDRRAVQISKFLMQYFSETEFADYDHYIKMRAKLLMDAREIEDKVKLGQEQLKALNATNL